MKKTFRIIIFSLAIATSLFSFGVFSSHQVSAATIVNNQIQPADGDRRNTSSKDANGNIITIVNTADGGIQTFSKDPSGNVSLVSNTPASAFSGKPATSESCQPGWFGTIVNAATGFNIASLSFNCLVASIANKVLGLAAWVLWMAGLIFKITLDYSLDMTKFINGLAIVNIGWVIFRDIANICFIFILLAIAIGTILRIDSYNVKKTLATVIIAALLLNFSLFFTKVVIDASNILALQFYSQIIVNGNSSAADGGLSSAMMKALGIESIYSNPNDQGGNNPILNQGVTLANITVIGFGGSILILCTAFVFLAGTILFIIRTVVLIFLMILSPLAFMCLSLPALKGTYSKWQKKLIDQALFAPAYMILIYIVFKAIGGTHTGVDGKSMNFASLMTGGASSIGTLYTFVILIALMLGSLIAAKQFGATGGDFARNWAGKASFGAAGWMGRQTVGRGAKALQEAGWVKNMSAKSGVGGMFGRGLEKGLKRTSESSFDLRNTAAGKGASGAVGGLGDVGGKGGFAKSFKDSEKEWKDQQKRVGEMSPSELSGKEALDVRNAADVSAKRAAENTLDLANKEIESVEKIIAESGVGTKEDHEKLEEAKKKKKRAEDLVGMFEDRVKESERIKEKADARGNSFATADKISKLASEFGITTAQMAMVRSVRKEKNKSPGKKALEEMVEGMIKNKGGEGDKEKKEEKPKP